MMEPIKVVSLPSGWPEDYPPRSALFELIPLGCDGGDYEDLASAFRRLSARHGILPWTLAFRAVAPLAVGSDETVRDNFADTCYSLAVAGVQDVAQRWATALNRLTLREDLELRTLLPLRGVVPAFLLISQVERFCPVCYLDDERAKREKYNRLLWAVGCVKACPIHGSLLEPVPRSKRFGARPRQFGFQLPGVSRVDGSSLASETFEPASEEDVQIARLVVDLLNDVNEHPEVFSKATAPTAFFRHAADVLFGGTPALFAEYLGVSKGSLSEWMDGSIRTSLPHLVRIAHCCGCSLADVILGNKVMLKKVPQPSVRPTFGHKRQDGARRPRDELIAEFERIVESGEVGNAKEAADRLQVSEKFLRMLSSELAGQLVQRGKESRSQAKASRIEGAFEEVWKSFSMLRAANARTSRRAVLKHVFDRTGLTFPRHELAAHMSKAHQLVGSTSARRLACQSGRYVRGQTRSVRPLPDKKRSEVKLSVS
ncbi:TniQ family protein [Paraburkholderia guartelaensis]|uniref:TniQ family protein n=1 Tax=Paraburkholderia guartelaensis TaxID=2546446 RepID=A0ABU9SCZ7_9BURK